MKEKIIGYILYLIILFGLVYSMSILKEEYVEKWELRLDNLQSTIDRKIANDDKFFENSRIYINRLDTIVESQGIISGQIFDINERLDEWEAE